MGDCFRQSCCLLLLAWGLSARPPAPPSGRSRRENTGGFPRGKQSARFALPCALLVVCLNSGSLTAFGGCAHWARASLRSPLHPFGSPSEAIERPIGLQAMPTRQSRRVSPHRGEALAAKLSFSDAMHGAFRSPPAPLRIATRSNRAPHRAARPSPAPESARQAPSKGNCLRQSCLLLVQAGWLSARPLHPFGSPPEAIERPIGLQALLLPPACHPFTFAMYISICTVIFSKRFSRRISSGMENVMGVMQRKSDDWRSSRGNSQRTVACSKISPCPSR